MRKAYLAKAMAWSREVHELAAIEHLDWVTEVTAFIVRQPHAGDVRLWKAVSSSFRYFTSATNSCRSSGDRNVVRKFLTLPS